MSRQPNFCSSERAICALICARFQRGQQVVVAPADMKKLNTPLACIKKPDMNKAPQSGRLIRPRLAGFEVTGDKRLNACDADSG